MIEMEVSAGNKENPLGDFHFESKMEEFLERMLRCGHRDGIILKYEGIVSEKKAI